MGFISVYNYLTNDRVADKDLNIEDEITAIKFSSQVFLDKAILGNFEEKTG